MKKINLFLVLFFSLVWFYQTNADYTTANYILTWDSYDLVSWYTDSNCLTNSYTCAYNHSGSFLFWEEVQNYNQYVDNSTGKLLWIIYDKDTNFNYNINYYKSNVYNTYQYFWLISSSNTWTYIQWSQHIDTNVQVYNSYSEAYVSLTSTWIYFKYLNKSLTPPVQTYEYSYIVINRTTGQIQWINESDYQSTGQQIIFGSWINIELDINNNVFEQHTYSIPQECQSLWLTYDNYTTLNNFSWSNYIVTGSGFNIPDYPTSMFYNYSYTWIFDTSINLDNMTFSAFEFWDWSRDVLDVFDSWTWIIETKLSYLLFQNESEINVNTNFLNWIQYIILYWTWDTDKITAKLYTQDNIFLRNISYNTKYKINNLPNFKITFSKQWNNHLHFFLDFWQISKGTKYSEVCHDPNTWLDYVDWELFTGTIVNNDIGGADITDITAEDWMINLSWSVNNVFSGSFFINLWILKNNSWWLDSDCNPIFTNWEFNYIQNNPTSITSLLRNGSFINLWTRWELIILNVNLIGWIYDGLSFIVNTPLNILSFVISPIFDVFEPYFWVVVDVTRNNNYCYFWKNYYLTWTLSSYYDYPTQTNISVPTPNNYDILISVLAWLFIMSILFL